MKKIRFLRDYLAEKYSRPLQRIPIDLGLSCPHRDEQGRGGCYFCGEDGSRARHLENAVPLKEQVEKGVEYVKARYNSDPPYYAYFQAFTATNAEVPRLRRLYDEVLALADFKGMIVATRPDCLPDECIDFLAEYAEKYDLWVELGVQTAKDETLEVINRGHNFAAVESAVKRLAERGIKVAAHVIIGLPGESHDDFMNTAEKLARLPFSGIKVHNLLVLKGTRMERLLMLDKVVPLSEYDYARELAQFLLVLPEGWVVMRITAEAQESRIIAPKWWMKKSQFIDMFMKVFESMSGNSGDMPDDGFHALRTEDGSYTFYHPTYKQHFHSVAGAWMESVRKYIEPCRLKEKLEKGENLSLLDIGFGMGFNACAAAQLAETVGKAKLYIVSLESDRNALSAAQRLPEHPGAAIVKSLSEKGRWENHFASIDLVWGDARDYVSMMKARYDFIFLDGFSPDTNPELWTLDFMLKLKDMLKPDGFLATYSSAFPFLGALVEAGFNIYESKPFGRRRGGTVAALDANPWLPPLSNKDFMIVKHSTAGTPYRDPSLRWSREQIIEHHAEQVAELRRSGMPKWYRE